MRVVELLLGDAGDVWRRAGFTVGEDGAFDVGGIRLQCTGEGRGILAWTLAVDDPSGRAATVDGLPTTWVADRDAPQAATATAPTVHRNGATLVDHVVLGSPNRERSIPVLEQDLGLTPRRQTEHRLNGRNMVQTFFLLAPTLLEMISRPEAEGDGPLTFWGLAFVAPDLDATKAVLGEALSEPKDAVQSGRRIASVRTEAHGLSVPVAFLTPRG